MRINLPVHASLFCRLLFIHSVCCAIAVQAQTALPGRVWTRLRDTAYGVDIYGCALDAAGNVYAAGMTDGPIDGQTNAPPGDNYDACLIKWNANGEWQWTRLWGSTSEYDEVYAHMAICGTNAVYVAGRTEGGFDGETNTGEADVFLSKWRPDGTREWTRIWGSTLEDEAEGLAVNVDSNVFVSGYTDDAFGAGQTNSGNSDIFLTKVLPDGTIEWSRVWGSTNNDWAAGLAADDDTARSVYVAGEAGGPVYGQAFAGKKDMILTKFDDTGAHQWTRLCGSTNSDTAYDAALDSKGGIYVAGWTSGSFDGQTNPGSSSAFLNYWTAGGTRSWTRIFGPTNMSQALGVTVDTAGYIYVSGNTHGPFNGWTHSPPGFYNIYLTQWSESGTCRWTRIFGPVSNYSYNGVCHAEGGSVCVGYMAAGGGFDGQSVSTNNYQKPCVSVYETDYRPDGIDVETTNGHVVLSWNGAWDCVFDVQVAMDLTGIWMTVPVLTNLPGSEVIAATNGPNEAILFSRLLARPSVVWRAPEGMAYIPAGDSVMGQVGIAEPVHTNFISGFWMDRTEVTRTKYNDVMNWAITNGYVIENVGGAKNTNHPIQVVNWYCCVKWANARSEKDGLTPCYYTDAGFATVYRTGAVDVLNTWVNWNANGYRLPTEAEWEKAARGGASGYWFPWAGNTISHSQANYYSTNLYAYDVSPTRGYHPTYAVGGFPYTAPAGSFATNAFGLYDMAGNVSEWCWDWYDVNYYTNPPVADPKGPTSGSYRARRGGFWYIDSQAERCRVARRDYFLGGPGNGDDTLGFRCVRRE